MTSSFTLNSQVLIVLCTTIQTTDQLLAGLQARFPATAWTMSLLISVLTQASKQGRISIVTNSPLRWKVNKNMVNLFPLNIQYENVCNAIFKSSPCLPIELL